MKKTILVSAIISFMFSALAQKYPDPEFVNEIYFFKKDSSSLMRLEKGSSKLDTKTKMAGFGGAESGYEIANEKSEVRLNNAKSMSFIFFNSSPGSSAARDSMMRANGMDPSMLNTMMDPSNMISLYKADGSKNKRKVFLQKSGGMFSGGKSQSSDKYTFSARKVRDGYWELVVDKTLPKGEYIFTLINMSMGNMDGSTLLFAFGID
jgi:hypothetical protein